MSLRHRHKRREAEKLESQQKVWDKLKDTNPSPRRLHARWTVETDEVVNALQGMGVEAELTKSLIDGLAK